MNVSNSKRKKKKYFLFGLLLLFLPLLIMSTNSYALEDDEIVNIITKNDSLFVSNSLAGSVIRYISWGVTFLLVEFAKAAANLYDTCFGFIDFTKFKEVKTFINDWQEVFIALVCLSLLLIGILLCIGWEKKPKILINLLIAVTVISSSTFVINKLNSFISTEVRDEILGDEGSASVVFNIVGSNLHDLIYLDNTVGLANLNTKNNAKKVYSKFTEQQFDNMDINETVDPDVVSEDAVAIMESGILMQFSEDENVSFAKEELYSGVAWTDMLNEYYYRYTVDWVVMWLELISIIIIYLFMSYKVVKIIFEIVVHRLLAYLYAANLNNNQKILKIIDSLKDSYILLLMTTVIIKLYLIACNYISSWDVNGISKGFILLFLAFAVIDGPNLIQKLTGVDIGASDGMGKMMSMFYGARMVAGTVGSAGRAVKGSARAIKNRVEKGKEMFSGQGDLSGTDEVMSEAVSTSSEGVNNLNQQRDTSQNNYSQNQQNGRQDNRADIHKTVAHGAATGVSGSGSSQKITPDGRNMNTTANLQQPNQQMMGSAFSTFSNSKNQREGNGMSNIGKQMMSDKDALNGTTGLSKSNLTSMEKDIAKTTSSSTISTPSSASNSSPLKAEGHLLNDGTEGIKQATKMFEEMK